MVKSASFKPAFLKAMMDLVREGRRQSTSYRGEFAVWMDEQWESLSWPAKLTKLAKGHMKDKFVEAISPATEISIVETPDIANVIGKSQIRRAL
jgi:hypothetical protein